MKDRMTLATLRQILADRGFTVVLTEGGEARLRGKRGQATPALMRVLAYWREELIAELKRERALRDDPESARSAPVEQREAVGDGALPGAR